MQTLDVIMTSSCRSIIKKTVKSFLGRVNCSMNVRFLVHIDVLNHESLPVVEKYLEEVGKAPGVEVEVKINSKPDKISHYAHSQAINYLFKQIKSDYYFHLEDDWIFLKDIDLDPLINIMKKYEEVVHIRFSKDKIKNKSWLYHLSNEVSDKYLYPNEEVVIDEIPLVRVPVWSFNPHLGRSDIIRKIGAIPVENNPEKYICSKYPDSLDASGIYIYGKIGDKCTVRDVGRSILREKIRKYKYILSGGKHVKYKFS